MKSKKSIYFLLISLSILLASCTPVKEKDASENKADTDPQFKKVTIADSVTFLWAYAPADIFGDGISDLIFVSNNARGGYLGYFEGKTDGTIWNEIIIASVGPDGGTFAQGDLEVADMDGDGDIDIVVSEHPGEWDASTEDSKIYWYENPSWTSHFIGTAPDFVKDFSLVDLNKDQKTDVVALTFESSSLSVFQQDASDKWTRVHYVEGFGNLHEGMHVGDVNGDSWMDIVADAHIFYNPTGNLQENWEVENLDPKWNNQSGDWSRNGTKIFVCNTDEDQEAEVFVSHSERPGYPVSLYNRTPSGWKEDTITAGLPACHTLQVFDFNKDGFMDVLTGVNRTRAKDLGFDEFDVTINFGQKNGSWNPYVLHQEGIYNGQVIDYDGDGDLDIFSYQTHDATTVQLMINQFSIYKNYRWLKSSLIKPRLSLEQALA